MKPRSIFLAALMLILSTDLNAQEIRPLYPGRIPNYIEGPNEQSSTRDGVLRISKVSSPTYQYFAAPGAGKKPCVVICPGGGYRILAAEHEGTEIAKKLNEKGINAMVLYYRLPDSTRQVDKSIAPLQDAQQAIALARGNAEAWNIDPGKVGIMGFSAGGHLASTAATHFDKDHTGINPGANLRPDFQILIYPVISFRAFGHKGSASQLIGPDFSEARVALYSNDEQVSPTTPPAFLVHASDDKTVPLKNSLNYVERLNSFGIPADLHVYAGGGHGFGLNNKTTTDEWFVSLLKWFTARKFM